jgi:hypothetical protein
LREERTQHAGSANNQNVFATKLSHVPSVCRYQGRFLLASGAEIAIGTMNAKDNSLTEHGASDSGHFYPKTLRNKQ